MTTNTYGQPVGRDLGGWEPAAMIPEEQLTGTYVRLRPLTVDDAEAIHSAFADASPELFTYMSFAPFESVGDVLELSRFMLGEADWSPYVVEVDGTIEGFEAYLRINPLDGVIEIGSIMFSPRLQRTTAATESAYLLMRHAFESGYRRVEWKCDDLNAPSRRAGERLGFRHEGTFLNATHYKGRNRDTAWFAMTVEDWAGHRPTFEAWLNESNFDQSGGQIRSLSDLRQSG